MCCQQQPLKVKRENGSVSTASDDMLSSSVFSSSSSSSSLSLKINKKNKNIDRSHAPTSSKSIKNTLRLEISVTSCHIKV